MVMLSLLCPVSLKLFRASSMQLHLTVIKWMYFLTMRRSKQNRIASSDLITLVTGGRKMFKILSDHIICIMLFQVSWHSVCQGDFLRVIHARYERDVHW